MQLHTAEVRKEHEHGKGKQMDVGIPGLVVKFASERVIKMSWQWLVHTTRLLVLLLLPGQVYSDKLEMKQWR